MGLNNLQNNSTVKVVDFAPFLDGSDRQGVSNAILDSFKTTGFVYLINHGLPQNKIDSMFSWVSANLNDCIPNLCSIFYFILVSLVEKAVFTANGDQTACSTSFRLPSSRFVIITSFSILLGRFCHLGYSAPGREKVYHLKSDGDDLDMGKKNNGTNNAEVEVMKDIKESFEVGREGDPILPNIWYPDGVLPGFQDACLDFFWVRPSTESDIMYDSFL